MKWVLQPHEDPSETVPGFRATGVLWGAQYKRFPSTRRNSPPKLSAMLLTTHSPQARRVFELGLFALARENLPLLLGDLRAAVAVGAYLDAPLCSVTVLEGVLEELAEHAGHRHEHLGLVAEVVPGEAATGAGSETSGRSSSPRGPIHHRLSVTITINIP
jgi:hypothetical protein